MARHLSPTTHLVAIGDDVVVLDTRTNTYFCLAAAARDLRIGPDGVEFGDADLAEEFEQAGLLVEASQRPRVAQTPRPARDLGLKVAARVRLGDVLLILAAWTTMLLDYHLVRFDRVVAAAHRGRRAGRAERLAEDARTLIAAFERVLPWLPFQGVCLYRSFLLLRVLRWRGHDARWVFGVRTWPFHAHCWLQIGDTALDDTADRLQGLTPIMVV
ncbi:lasso peptide biosynthesis B2 protein [Caulobacter segnis]|uniref:lasso peptide biosynthesis B2 protein n=1 Tax=Caulobacter segnis TaxID=88688 RepID=UPI0028588DAE|nr:lasso peptide biosynthesis B2 protein [Caulobacter segnis]MDR6624482.1 hypothetical protein [Caulobacter segnis]